MRRNIPSRHLAVVTVVGVLVVALLGTITLNPVATKVAQAQSEPITTVNGIEIPPPIPELDDIPAAVGKEGPANDALVSGTPAPPVFPADASTVVDAPDNGGSLTTSLGGSDIAVSSVGGSYEVDGPKKRRSHRNK